MRYRVNYILGIILVLGNVIQLTSCGSSVSNEGNFIFTQVPADVASSQLIENGEYRYKPSQIIVMGSMVGSEDEIEILTKDFYSARAPEVSHNGRQMVFSGQRNESDAWQIWVLDFKTGETSQVTVCENNCTDPTWLPDGRIVFSKNIDEGNIKHHALFSIAADGCCEQRLTFQPHQDLNATVLHDGRIMFSSQQIFPEKGKTKYLVMRPDGTKAELFYHSENNTEISQAVETNSQVFFAQVGHLKSVKFSRPLHTMKSFEDLRDIMIQSVFPIDDKHLLASVKKQSGNLIGIVNLDLETNEVDDLFFSPKTYHAIEPVIVKNRALPRRLPSRVNIEKETGYFVCMDANESEMAPHIEEGKTTSVQVLGINNILGETQVAEDGSFYLELKADQPVRFQTLNKEGEIVRGPSSWMWVRPNERRGCLGCHEDREMAPENVVPKAIEKAPVAMIK